MVRVKATAIGDLADSEWSERPITTRVPPAIPEPTSYTTESDTDLDTLTVRLIAAIGSPSDIRFFVTVYDLDGANPDDPTTWHLIHDEAEARYVFGRTYIAEFSGAFAESPHGLRVRGTANNYTETMWWVSTPNPELKSSAKGASSDNITKRRMCCCAKSHTKNL